MEPAGHAYAICALNDVPNRRAKAFSLIRAEADGSERPWHIFVVRRGSKVHGFVNRCPHQGTNLDWERNQFLDPNSPRIMCGKHGSLFEFETGECVEGPCKGARLEMVQVSVIDGDICVSGVTLAEE
jgi:nitrite reductase/ring-hydroxylating ferredoxin subunit